MSEPLDDALARVRALLLDDGLVRAVASGRRRAAVPRWRRVELRHVDLKGGRHLQVVAHDDAQAHTANHALGEPAVAALTELLAEPFGNWHLETATEVHQVRVTKKGAALWHRRRREAEVAPDHGHDRARQRLLADDDPVWAALGLAGADGTVRPSRRAKLRQVEDFLRILDASLTDALTGGHLRTPTDADPLRVVDLGCGNSYLTLAAHRYLAQVRRLPVVVTGVDVKEQAGAHHARAAAALGLESRFVVGTIAEADVAPAPEVVLALHACDTATDDALARAVGWAAPLVLAAPCCHHDLAAQLRGADTPEPFGELTRHGILRERLADTLTDGLRGLLLREAGYRVEVMEFVDSAHTPRNTLLRAVRTGAPGDARGVRARAEYDALVDTWQVRPRLGALLAAPAGAPAGEPR